MNQEQPGGKGGAVTHRFIVYQYGKVGSTSVTAALNRLAGCEAHQTHFLGESAFSGTLKRLMNPDTPDYFFEHSAGQLLENLRLYRHFARREIDSTPLTVISLAREPFDWFRSALVQDAQEHLVSLRTLLDNRGIACGGDEDAMTAGLELLFGLLLDAITHFGSLDAMCRGRRYQELEQALEHAGSDDFRAIMFFVNIFMRPHLWYHTHFMDVLEFGLGDMSPMDCGGLRRKEGWGNTYVLNYESMATELPAVVSELGFSSCPQLTHENATDDKPHSEVVSAAFGSDAAQALRRVCHSEDTRYLGYVPDS